MGFLEIAEYIGIAAFAYSALLAAKQEKLDLLGSLIIAFLTALGGGVIRDILVDRAPVSFTQYLPVLIVFLVIVAALLLKSLLHEKYQNKILFIYSDAIGLVSFAINGALVGATSQFHIIGVAFLALITAVGGGVMRDLLINRVPFILKEEFYGSIALIIGVTVWILHQMHWINLLSLSILFVVGVWIRIVAYQKRWQLPRI